MVMICKHVLLSLVLWRSLRGKIRLGKQRHEFETIYIAAGEVHNDPIGSPSRFRRLSSKKIVHFIFRLVRSLGHV